MSLYLTGHCLAIIPWIHSLTLVNTDSMNPIVKLLKYIYKIVYILSNNMYLKKLGLYNIGIRVFKECYNSVIE